MMSSVSERTSPRAYDATRRRERAVLEREQTRRRVIDAAHRLFVSKGFTATTVADIAAEADVALQSVYTAGGNKAELLRLATQVAIAGDHEPLTVLDRVGRLAEESDPRRQVRLIAERIAQTIERAAPILVAQRQAAAVDAGVAEALRAEQLLRLQTFRGMVGHIRASALQRGLTHDRAAELLWAAASPESVLLLIGVRGLSGDALADHLEELTRRLLLGR